MKLKDWEGATVLKCRLFWQFEPGDTLGYTWIFFIAKIYNWAHFDKNHQFLGQLQRI